MYVHLFIFSTTTVQNLAQSKIDLGRSVVRQRSPVMQPGNAAPAALVSWKYWHHFCSVGGCGDVSAIFYIQSKGQEQP